MSFAQSVTWVLSSGVGVLCGALLTADRSPASGPSSALDAPSARLAYAPQHVSAELSHPGERARPERPMEPPARSELGVQEHGEPSEEEVAPQDRVEPEQAREQAHEQFRKLVESVDQEPVDGEFAVPGERALAGDLRMLGAEHDFALVSATCHRSHCTATVEWSQAAQARERFGALLHHPYALNCATQTLLDLDPDRPAPSGRFRSTVVFDCSELRTREALTKRGEPTPAPREVAR